MRRVPAILMLVVLVAPLFFAALAIASVGTWALNRKFYIGLIDDERLYQIPDTIDAASWQACLPDLGPLSALTSGKAAREILPPSFLHIQALRVLNEAFDSMDRPLKYFDTSLDLTPVKANLLGEPGKRFASALAQDLPVVGTSAGLVIKAGSLPISRPSSLSVNKQAALIRAGIPAFVKSLPDTVRLSDSSYYPYVKMAWGWGPSAALGVLIYTDIALLLAAQAFWLAASLIGGGNKIEWLQWLGWSLFAPAAAAFLIGLCAVLGFFSGWIQWGIGTAHFGAMGFDPSFSAAVLEAAQRAISRAGTGFIAAGATAGVVAVGLLAWSRTMARDKEIRATPIPPRSRQRMSSKGSAPGAQGC